MMRDKDKSKEQLILELRNLRRKIRELKTRHPARQENQFSVPCHRDRQAELLQHSWELAWNPQEADLPVVDDSGECEEHPGVLRPLAGPEAPNGWLGRLRSVTETGSFDLTWITMASFGKLLHAVPMPILLVSASGEIQFENYAFVTISGRFVSFAGKSLYSLFPGPEESQHAQALVDRVLNKRKPQVREGVLVIHNRELWSRMHLRSIRFGKVRSLLVLVEDLSAERRELCLNEKYKKLVEIFPIGIAEFLPDKRVSWNASEEELVSAIMTAGVMDGNARFAWFQGLKDIEDLLGRRLCDILPPGQNNAKFFRQWIRQHPAISFFETKELWPDGKPRYFEITLVGNVRGDVLLEFWLMKQDITERKLVQEELLQKIRTIEELYEHMVESGKAKAISEYTATVAHELRQPLTIIGGFARRMAKECPTCEHGADQSKDKWFDIIISEVSRLEKILHNLVEFTKRDDVHLRRVNPNEVIQHVLSVYEEQLKEKNLSLVLNLGAKTEEIPVDADRFQQVVRNLVANAVEASPPHETIIVECGVAIPSDAAKSSGDLESGTFFEMKIHNMGKPIEKEHLKKIFNPFFTTKDYGTGLGLTLSRKIVEDHNGSISVKSDETGTTVTVWLPMKQSPNDTSVLPSSFTDRFI
jgi:signal transduction histidine kinase